MKTLIPDECCMGQMESNRLDIGNRFLEEVVTMFAESIDISWKDRNTFISILKNYMKNNFNSMLREYLDYQLTIAAASMIKELDLPSDTKVNVEYAIHAKYSDLIEAVKHKIDIMTKPPVKKKFGSICNIMKTVRSILEELSYPQLLLLLDEHDKWFKTFDDVNLIEERNIASRSSMRIVDWICNSDPVIAEGGLMSFMEEMKNKGLLT